MEKVKPELIDELLKGYEKPEDIIGENALLKSLTKALLERAMNAELTGRGRQAIQGDRLPHCHGSNGHTAVVVYPPSTAMIWPVM
jgi:hypothetical protein